MNPWTPLILATVGWGLSNVLSKAVLNTGLDTFTFLPIRYLIGLVTLLVFLGLTGRLHRPELDIWKKGALLGVINMSVPTMLMTRGLEYIPATVGSLLIALIPIATVASAHYVVRGERFQARTLPGLLVSLIGVGLLVNGGLDVVGNLSELLLGVALTTSGVILAGMGGAVSRRFASTTPPSRLVLPQFVFGLATLMVGLAVFGGGGDSTVTNDAWWLIIASGTAGTALPFAAFLFAAETNSASRLGSTAYVVPVLATIGAIIFLGETFTAIMVFGAVLILSGVYWSEKVSHYAPTPGTQSAA